MSGRRADIPALAAGIAAVALGALLALEQLDLIALTPGVLAAAFCAAAGAILVALGLSDGEA